MQKRGLSHLHVIESLDDGYPFAKLLDKIKRETFDHCYFTRYGKLYGWVSLDELVYSKDRKSISINKRLSSIAGWNDKAAREVFIKKKKMPALPVVDDEGKLIGEYCRTSVSEYVKRNIPYLRWIGKSRYRSLAVIRSPIEAKQETLHFFLDHLPEEVQADVYENWNDLCTDAGVILFSDKAEKVCARLLVGATVRRSTWLTLEEILSALKQSRQMSAFSDSMDGIKLYTFNFNYSDRAISRTEYIKQYNAIMPERQKLCASKRKLPGDEATIPPELKKDFLDELYTPEYWAEFKSRRYAQYKMNGVTWLKEETSRYVNISNGYRRTLYFRENGTNVRHVWFFGRCVFVGSRVEDKHTIESVVQKDCNRLGYPCEVRNRAAWDDRPGRIWKMVNTSFCEGDIVIIHDMPDIPKATDINPARIAYEHAMPFSWFTDRMPHANHHAMEIWGHAIFDAMQTDLSALVPENRKEILPRKKYIELYYLDTFFRREALEQYQRIGSIVMNCNPFTKGHRFLIEEARRQVDFLIVFVVEEDQSYFDFEDRFAMVREGTADMEGVLVVPSGDFILSASTFPEYFIKIADKDIIQNVEYDITLFAECIAKPLGIGFRFVGEERSDPVTAEYNKAMHRILPSYGIEVIEIPRIEANGEAISASVVRTRLEVQEPSSLEELLPVSTMRYLRIRDQGVSLLEIDKGRVYWITGLSGAGKTTIGTLLYRKLRAKKPNVFLLDGDMGRRVFNDKSGYARADREDGAYRNGRVCKMISDQGIDVVCCTISMFDGVRKWNRENIPGYCEIYLDVPMEVLMARDQKGLYTGARQGRVSDVVGMDLALEFPKAPDVKFVNDGTTSPEGALDRILEQLKELGKWQP